MLGVRHKDFRLCFAHTCNIITMAECKKILKDANHVATPHNR